VSARVLGVQVLGEGATDLVHLGQMAIANGATANYFVEHMFNFPTMTEAYRIAAFDVLKRLGKVADVKDYESEYRRTRCI